MNLVISGILLLSLNLSFAHVGDKNQNDKIKQKMEEDSFPTYIGGARGGQLEEERSEDKKDDENRDERKENKLFEHNGLYRRGL